jgi:SPP1 family predicted phage head-tail adaptor
MNPNKLNKRITFQKKLRGQDAEGNWIEIAWENAFTVWGAIDGILSMRNSEVVVAGTLGVKSPKKISIRLNKNLTHDMRAIYKGRIFDVLDFDLAKNSKAYYEIMCNEVEING